MERVMRFELTTSTLARWRSTTELHPQRACGEGGFYTSGGGAQVKTWGSAPGSLPDPAGLGTAEVAEQPEDAEVLT